MSKLKFFFHVLIALIILPVFVYADLTVFFNYTHTQPQAPVVQKLNQQTPATINNYLEHAITRSGSSSYPHFINY